MPFTHEGTPVELKAKGKRIPNWQLDQLGLVGKLQPSPVKSNEPVEPITLIPMGAARLRISSFPVIGDGKDAHQWVEPPKPAYRVSASHCWDGDTVTAVADGIEPNSSNDHSISRLTWWNHRGTEEWVQAEFDNPRAISEVAIYWFDDTGGGGCRVPAYWTLRYRKDGDWVDVKNTSQFAVDKDCFNKVTFEPVKTEALRLDVKLQPRFSGGILEWRIE
jgi:hypothetical protein